VREKAVAIMNEEEKYTKTLKEFVYRVRSLFGDRISRIYVYGSFAKGTVSPYSDIDIFLVYKNIDAEELLDKLSEISFDIVCEYGKLVEVVFVSEEEFKAQVGKSPFLWEVLKHGKVVYGAGSTEWKLDFKGYLELAEEYLTYAKDAINENKIRLGIDAGYNAIELVVKALIISTGTGLASSHGGVIQQFGELFVKTGKIGKELGKDSSKALMLRAQARYLPSAKLERKDGDLVISVAERIIEVARKELLGGKYEKTDRS